MYEAFLKEYDLNEETMEKIIKEVSRTSVNGAIINRKFSPAVFRSETMKKINLQCHIVTP